MLGGIIGEVGSHPMRAGKGSLATPLKRSIVNWKNLAWANTSREIGGASCTFKELGPRLYSKSLLRATMVTARCAGVR